MRYRGAHELQQPALRLGAPVVPPPPPVVLGDFALRSLAETLPREAGDLVRIYWITVP